MGVARYTKDDKDRIEKVTGPLVTQVFIPLMTQLSPSRTATVLHWVRSEEWSGSVRQKAATFSPAMAGRKYSS